MIVPKSKFKLISTCINALENFWCKNIDARLNIERAYLVQFFSNFVIAKVVWKKFTMILLKVLHHEIIAYKALK